MSLPRLKDYRPGRVRKADRPSPWLDGFPCEIVDYGATALRLWLPEPPSANDWWRMYRGHMVKTPLARDYQQRVQAHLESRRLIQRWRGVALFPTQWLAVSIVWYRKHKRGDLDKRVGIVLDALQDAVYTRDAQIVDLHAKRIDASEAKLDVTIRVVEAA